MGSFFGKASRVNNSLEVQDGQLVFVGGAKYDAIPMDSIESIAYDPRDEDWQEISIKVTGQDAFNYYLNSDVERLQKAVGEVNHELEPVQPICKFIMSTKQGSLSGKD